jgi:Ca2+-binding EF-hand superfamily protein
MQHFDSDGNGKIDLKEYIEMIEYMQKVHGGM